MASQPCKKVSGGILAQVRRGEPAAPGRGCPPYQSPELARSPLPALFAIATPGDSQVYPILLPFL